VEGVKNFLRVKSEVDFAGQIDGLNKKNKFNQLPEIINQIIEEK